MSKVEIKGIIPPILTPMNDDESINEAELRNHVNRMIDAGVSGVFAFGTNGEAYAMSHKEKVQVLKVVVDETKKRVPVYAGTGCVTTKETITLSKEAEDLGADVLSVIVPYFAAASQDELYDHYKAVAESVKIPVVLYNIPARTGNALAPATVAKLAKDVPNILGAKDSSGNFDNMKQYIELTSDIGKDFSVLSGNDSLILPALMFGGKGGIAGCANVFPRTMVEIYEAFIAGDIERAKKVQDSIRMFRNCFKYGNPNTLVKLAAGLLGNPVGPCRRPFSKITPEGMEALKKTLELCKANGLH
ncbi:MAG: 4-hydroxy-tetrahydrodipicolinate synthase [Synergistaceae bacterium]|nr:4-hydroxy-tetrahydrodipicolinate synthase [Synergistaceae bacterium]MBR0094803.1 4-hydroxy-tetrahydrodipicolinate synthase [Synergistaceae bacterium]